MVKVPGQSEIALTWMATHPEGDVSVPNVMVIHLILVQIFAKGGKKEPHGRCRGKVRDHPLGTLAVPNVMLFNSCGNIRTMAGNKSC